MRNIGNTTFLMCTFFILCHTSASYVSCGIKNKVNVDVNCYSMTAPYFQIEKIHSIDGNKK